MFFVFIFFVQQTLKAHIRNSTPRSPLLPSSPSCKQKIELVLHKVKRGGVSPRWGSPSPLAADKERRRGGSGGGKGQALFVMCSSFVSFIKSLWPPVCCARGGKRERERIQCCSFFFLQKGEAGRRPKPGTRGCGAATSSFSMPTLRGFPSRADRVRGHDGGVCMCCVV